MLRVFDATGSTVQIATWNVNSVRTRLDQVLSWLENEQPDLLCLQETKVDDPLFPLEDFKSAGWHVQIHGQKAYNGVALISQEPLEDVRYGFVGELPDDAEAADLGEQKRVISALLNGVRVLNLYVPNGIKPEVGEIPVQTGLAQLPEALSRSPAGTLRTALHGWRLQHRP